MPSTNSAFTATSAAVSLLLWLFISPSMQAAISDSINSVCPENCNHHGDCHVLRSKSVVCSCHIGWGGNACEIPCGRSCVHGTCVFAGQKQVCLCSVGFKGEMCEEPGYDMGALLNLTKLFMATFDPALPFVVDPSVQIQANIQRGSSSCTANFVCQNGGRCANGRMGGYLCQCNTSRHAGHFCQYTCPKQCLNGGTCARLRRHESKTDITEIFTLSESEAVYRCICPLGYGGERCQRYLRTFANVNTSLGT